MKKIAIVCTGLILASCGARKSEVVKTETEIKQTTEEVAKTETQTETTTTDTSVIEEQEYVLEPVNNDKPIEVIKPDGSKIVVHNARIQSKKKTEQVNVKQEIKEQAKTETKKKDDTEIKQSVKKKNTDRQQYNWLSVQNVLGLLVFITIIGFIIWFYIRRKRQETT